MANLISKSKLQEIRQSLELAISEVAKQHGIESIKLGNIRYDESGFKVPIEAVFEGGETKEMKNLRLNAKLLGFKPEIAGATIIYGQKQYEVIGLGRSAFHLKGVDGKNYTAKVEIVRHTLEMQNSPLVEPRKTFPELIVSK